SLVIGKPGLASCAGCVTGHSCFVISFMHRKSAYFLVIAVLAMLVIGIVMLFSTSAYAKDSHGDVYYFVKRQAVWIAVGLVVCLVAARLDYHLWSRTWWIWFGLAAVLLALCFAP